MTTMDSGFTYFHPTGLPDPEHDAEFYQGVPARRFVAWIIDVILVGLMAGLASLVFGVMTLGVGFLLAPLIFLSLNLVYRIGFLANHSATLGMMFTGIEFRTSQGHRFGLTEAAIHTITYMIVFTSVVFQAMSIAFMMLGAHGRSLPDLLLGSVAINRAAE